MVKKQYIIPENNSSTVNEPIVAYNKSVERPQTPPCQYTIEELTEETKQAIKEYKQGKGIPHEQVKRKTL